MNDDEAASRIEAAIAPEEPQETPPVETPEPTETPAEETAQVEETPAPAAPVAEGDETPDAEDEIDWSQFIPQATNVPAPQADENGQVDIEALINYKVDQKVAANNAEMRSWQQVYKVLPEVASNPQLRDFVHNQRIADVANGGKGDLVEAAKAVKGLFGGAQAQGKAQAQASVTVQKAAGLETGAAATPPAPQNDLAERFANGDRKAAEEILAHWVENGSI